MVGSDNPAGHYFGLTYSSARGDTTFRMVRKNGTTQTLTNSIAVDTDPHFLYLSMFPDAGSAAVQMTIDSQAALTATTTLPGNTTDMRFIAGIENLIGSSRALRLGVQRVHQVY